MASGSTAMLRRAAQDSSCQASAELFEQRAEFLPLRNRGLGPLAVAVLPIPLARRAAATSAPPCNRQRPFFVAGDRQGFPLLVRAPHCRAVWNLNLSFTLHGRTTGTTGGTMREFIPGSVR
jgi:hypothetical protein